MFGAVDWGLIGEVISTSLIATIGATILFSLVIFGGSRSAEARRDGTRGSAAFAALAVVALVAFLGSVVLGLTIILGKG